MLHMRLVCFDCVLVGSSMSNSAHRNSRTAGEHSTFRIGILFTQSRSGAFAPQRSRLDDRCVYPHFPYLSYSEENTAPGIYHGTLNYESNSDDLIDGASLLPYPPLPSPSTSPSRNGSSATAEIPTSIALTEFHFVLLYKDEVIGVCKLDEKLTYQEIVPLVSFAFSR